MMHTTVRLIKQLAEKAGVTVESIRLGKKHYVVFVKSPYKRGIVTISASASDKRAHKNIIADMRRVTR